MNDQGNLHMNEATHKTNTTLAKSNIR